MVDHWLMHVHCPIRRGRNEEVLSPRLIPRSHRNHRLVPQSIRFQGLGPHSHVRSMALHGSSESSSRGQWREEHRRGRLWTSGDNSYCDSPQFACSLVYLTGKRTLDTRADPRYSNALIPFCRTGKKYLVMHNRFRKGERSLSPLRFNSVLKGERGCRHLEWTLLSSPSSHSPFCSLRDSLERHNSLSRREIDGVPLPLWKK